MSEKLIQDAITLKKPIIILYKDDLWLDHGCICFYQINYDLYSKNHKPRLQLIRDSDELKNIDSLVNKGFYILINNHTSGKVFKLLIEKLFNNFNHILFYNTNFSEEQLTILKSIKDNKYPNEILYSCKLKADNDMYFMFTDKDGIIDFNFTSVAKFSSFLKTIMDLDNAYNSRKELSNLEYENNEKEKLDIGTKIRELINSNSNQTYIYHNSPFPLQEIIRADYYDNATIDNIIAANYNIFETENND